jgi:hypothetical protein
MAQALRTAGGTYYIEAPPAPPPKTAEMRRAEREEKKAAKKRAKEMLAHHRACRIRGMNPYVVTNPHRTSTPGYCERVVKRVIRRLYGHRAEKMPFVMLEYHYWQARSAGFEPLAGQLEDGTPCEPTHEWYESWWKRRLTPDQRDALVRELHKTGAGLRRTNPI